MVLCYMLFLQHHEEEGADDEGEGPHALPKQHVANEGEGLEDTFFKSPPLIMMQEQHIQGGEDA